MMLWLSSKISLEKQMLCTKVRDGMLNLHSNPCPTIGPNHFQSRTVTVLPLPLVMVFRVIDLNTVTNQGLVE